MVGHFVRLKLKLTRNRLRRGGWLGLVGFIGMWIGALGFGSLLGLVAWLAGRTFGETGLGATMAMVGVGWLLLPVMAAALDETLDPRRLELLPIRRRQMALGLLAAAGVSPGTLMTLVAVLGALLAAASPTPGSVAAVVPAAIFIVWCLSSSRLLTTALTDLLRGGRGRDAAAIAISVLMGGAVIVASVSNPALQGTGAGSRSLPDFGRASALLGWSPPGALGRAMYRLGVGDWVVGIGLAVYGLVATALVIWLWQLVLTRLSTRAPHSGAIREAAGAGGIVPRVLAARPGPITATAGKELRYFRRDPRVRAQAIGLIVAMAALSFGAGRMLLGGPYAPFLAAMVGWMVASTGFNHFGMDDHSFWGYLVSGVPMRSIVIGKNLALGLIGLPALVVVAVGLAVISGNFSYLVPAILAGIGLTGVWMAVGNVTSLLGAFPLPESNLFGSRNASGAAMIASIGGLLAGGAATVPIGLMVGLPAALLGPLAALVGAVGALAWGIGAYWLGLRIASGLLDSRSLRLLEALDRPAI